MDALSEENEYSPIVIPLFWNKLNGVFKVHTKAWKSSFIQGPLFELLISCPLLSYLNQIEIKGDCVTACLQIGNALKLIWTETVQPFCENDSTMPLKWKHDICI